MAQFNTFYIPMTDDGSNAERMNAFLRAHRVLSVRQRDFPDGWGFCVEWIDGTVDAAVAGRPPYRAERHAERLYRLQSIALEGKRQRLNCDSNRRRSIAAGSNRKTTNHERKAI
ncbi:MAG: hypothetical protein IJG84_10680 [Kiritimatiellae bacterium]|nr:hypothetical protein [Kiritimatiellia bacterium]